MVNENPTDQLDFFVKVHCWTLTFKQFERLLSGGGSRIRFPNCSLSFV